MSDKYGRTFGAEWSLKHDMHPAESSTPEIRALKRRQETIHRFLQRDGGCGPCCREPRVYKECGNDMKIIENILKLSRILKLVMKWIVLLSTRISVSRPDLPHVRADHQGHAIDCTAAQGSRSFGNFHRMITQLCGDYPSMERNSVAFHCF